MESCYKRFEQKASMFSVYEQFLIYVQNHEVLSHNFQDFMCRRRRTNRMGCLGAHAILLSILQKKNNNKTCGLARVKHNELCRTLQL